MDLISSDLLATTNKKIYNIEQENSKQINLATRKTNANDDDEEDDDIEARTENPNNSESESGSDAESDLEDTTNKEDEFDFKIKNDSSNCNKTQSTQQQKQQSVEQFQVQLRSNKKKRSNELDSIRFSMYNIQNSQINEIDALLSELNQLQTDLVIPDTNNFDFRTSPKMHFTNHNNNNNIVDSFKTLHEPNASDESIEAIDHQFDEVLKFLAQTIDGHNSSPDISSSSPSMSLTATPNSDTNETKSTNNLASTNQNKRNSTDSAFMETISMPSSVSLAVLNSNNQHQNSSTTSCSSSAISENSPKTQTTTSSNPQQQSEAHKAELIRIALEKLKEANIKKLIVKAYTDDGCAKSIIIDETMKVYDVMLLLFSKNHCKPSVNYCIVEYLPKFNMERIFEDHENLVEAMSNWSRDSENQIFFTEKSDKYDLFLKPELYLTNETFKKIDESERSRLVDEFFQNIGSPVPEIEGSLYIKVESKKSWKKYYCVLRQSGLYYIPKGKSKKDMQCLFIFDKLDLYYGMDWRKEFKAPSEFCFALKYPQVQKKSSKYIKYLCCENQKDMKRWINGIRIAKFGKQLFENYKKITDLIELSKISGRIPTVTHRRLSGLSNNNNNNNRPRSNYSLASNSNSNYGDDQQTVSDSTPNPISNHYGVTNLVSASSLLIRKDSSHSIKDDRVSNDSNATLRSNRSNNFPIKQPNLAYTDQLKSLLQPKIALTDNQENKSWQNILSPISVSTNMNQTAQIRSNSPNQYHNNKTTVKIPVTTDLTKQLVNSAQKIQNEPNNELREARPILPQRNFEIENQINKINSFNFNFTSSNDSGYLNENVYDLPSPPIDLLQQQNNQFFQQTLSSPNQITRGMAPPVAPKPVLRRFNSSNENDPSFLSANQFNQNEIYRKKSFEQSNSGQELNRLSNQSRNSNNQLNQVNNELNAILARQKKKIEDSENESVTVKPSAIVKQPSPTITKKPPPPPRTDRSNSARKLSHERLILNNN